MEEMSERLSLEDGLHGIALIVDKAATMQPPTGVRYLFWMVTEPEPDSLASEFLGLYTGEQIALQFLGQCAAVGDDGIRIMNPVLFAPHETGAVLKLARDRWTAMCAVRDMGPTPPGF